MLNIVAEQIMKDGFYLEYCPFNKDKNQDAAMYNMALLNTLVWDSPCVNECSYMKAELPHYVTNAIVKKIDNGLVGDVQFFANGFCNIFVNIGGTDGYTGFFKLYIPKRDYDEG